MSMVFLFVSGFHVYVPALLLFFKHISKIAKRLGNTNEKPHKINQTIDITNNTN
jgi:hypothetical protein